MATSSDSANNRSSGGNGSSAGPSSLSGQSTLRKKWHQASDLFYHPFSADALQKLPANAESPRVKAKRADRIPDLDSAESRPLIRDYHTIPGGEGVTVRVPKKVATPVRVEAKVWFANERTWISYLSTAILTSTLSLALWNASDDHIGKWFALVYAVISVGIIIYGYAMFQKRLTMISARDAGQFEALWGPLLICAALFIALLANFIIRFKSSGTTQP